LKWQKPVEADLIKFLVEEKGFSENRVLSGIKKIKVNYFIIF
jgi:flap endonuclease-1